MTKVCRGDEGGGGAKVCGWPTTVLSAAGGGCRGRKRAGFA